MKKKNAKTLYLTSLALLALAPATQAANLAPVFPVAQFADGRGGVDFDDVLGWCSTWITDLQQARSNANIEATTGALGEAADMLLAALRQKAQQSQRNYPAPPPHTVEAIRLGLRLAEEVSASARSAALPEQLRAQISYIAADGVFGLVEWAYNNLDLNYYQMAMRSCRDPWSGCYAQAPSLPREYYDGVRQLAMLFLDFQNQISALQGSDSVELRSILETVRGAKEVLYRSVFRREMACAIQRLKTVEVQILGFLNGGSRIHRRDQVLLARHGLRDAKAMLEEFCDSAEIGCGCESRR